jgi:hypothetical protein
MTASITENALPVSPAHVTKDLVEKIVQTVYVLKIVTILTEYVMLTVVNV